MTAPRQYHDIGYSDIVINVDGSGRLLVVEHGRHAPAGLLADWAATRSLRIQTLSLIHI